MLLPHNGFLAFPAAGSVPSANNSAIMRRATLGLACCSPSCTVALSMYDCREQHLPEELVPPEKRVRRKMEGIFALAGGDEFRRQYDKLDSALLDILPKGRGPIVIIPTAAAQQGP